MATLLFNFPAQGRKLVEQFILDWITLGALLVVLIILELVRPFHRQFYIDDPRISFPMAVYEQVPNWLCLVFAPIMCFGVIVIFPLFYSPSKHRIRLIHMSLMGLLLSTLINGIITDLLKIWIGNPRPDFLARCIPAVGTPTGKLVGIEVCTNKNMAVLQEGFKSTPSGHSSNSFSGLLYLSFWLAGQMSVARPGAPLYRVVIVLLPVILALYVAASRTADYRHHFSDVISGSILGSLIAYLCYRKNFPSLTASKSFEPHYVNYSDQYHLPVGTDYYFDSENSSDDAAAGGGGAGASLV